MALAVSIFSKVLVLPQKKFEQNWSEFFSSWLSSRLSYGLRSSTKKEVLSLKEGKGNLNTQFFIDSIGSSQPEEKCHHAAATKDINTKYYIQ